MQFIKVRNLDLKSRISNSTSTNAPNLLPTDPAVMAVRWHLPHWVTTPPLPLNNTPPPPPAPQTKKKKMPLSMCRELTRNSQPVRNKNRENTRQRKKQSDAQDNIYVVRQFAYVHRVAGISLLSGKNTKCGGIVFFLTPKLQQQNPNHQNTFSTSRIHNGLQNRPKILLGLSID